MGNSCSVDDRLDREILEEYAELTYLTKSEIRHVFDLLKDVAPGGLRENFHYRFSREQVEKIFPQIQHNPFRDTIYRVFSSEQDGQLSFEDVLDMCSAFSENCPDAVRATWAFSIFDFDDDNQLTLPDLIEAIRRLTQFDLNKQAGFDAEHAEQIARMILEEMDLAQTGSISIQEFIHIVARMPDFSQTFRFKI